MLAGDHGVEDAVPQAGEVDQGPFHAVGGVEGYYRIVSEERDQRPRDPLRRL